MANLNLQEMKQLDDLNGAVGFPFVAQDSWLLVLLTYLDELSTQTLHRHLHPRTDATDIRLGQADVAARVKVQTWSPAKALLRLLAPQGSHRDSQANLHALGTLGHRAGVSKFLVADETTKREINNVDISAQDNQISVILISVQDEPKEPKNVNIVARRVLCSGEHIGEMFRDLKLAQGTYPAAERFDLSLASRGLIWNLFSLTLKDPEREIFTPERKPIPLWEERSVASKMALSRLPPEIVFDILEWVECSSSRDQMIDMSLWKKRPSRYHLVILLFFDASIEKLDDITAKTNECLRSSSRRATTEMTFEFIPFYRHKIKSRRNLMDFLDAHLYWNANISMCGTKFPPMHLMFEPPATGDSISLVELLSFGPPPAVATPTTLNDIVYRNMKGISHVNSEIHGGVFRKSMSEIICHPSRPFSDQPDWAPGSTPQREWIPAFYLTSSLSKDEDSRIRMSIKSNSDQDTELNVGRKLCGFVPWKTGEPSKLDGSMEDIWEIVKMVYFFGLPREIAFNFICIDSSSASDDSVILVMPDCTMMGVNYGGVGDTIPLPCLRGFTYTRVPASKAHAIRNRTEWDLLTEEFDEYCSHYVREGWPERGAFPFEPVPHYRRRDIRPFQRYD